MVDVSRRGFLALLGIAASTAAMKPIVSSIEAILPPAIPESLKDLVPEIEQIVSDCFLVHHNISYPIGKLLDVNVVKRNFNMPIRSGIYSDGRVMYPTKLNMNNHTTVKISTEGVLNDILPGYKRLQSLGNVGFRVDTILYDQHIELYSEHTTPVAVDAISFNPSMPKSVFHFELCMLDLKASRRPLQVTYVG
jgi:hypothetical protein